MMKDMMKMSGIYFAPIWRYARSSKDKIAQINTLKIKVSNEGPNPTDYGSTLNDGYIDIPYDDNKEITITIGSCIILVK